MLEGRNVSRPEANLPAVQHDSRRGMLMTMIAWARCPITLLAALVSSDVASELDYYDERPPKRFCGHRNPIMGFVCREPNGHTDEWHRAAPFWDGSPGPYWTNANYVEVKQQ